MTSMFLTIDDGRWTMAFLSSIVHRLSSTHLALNPCCISRISLRGLYLQHARYFITVQFLDASGGILRGGWAGLADKHLLWLVHNVPFPPIDRARFMDVRASDQPLFQQCAGEVRRLVNAAARDVNHHY